MNEYFSNIETDEYLICNVLNFKCDNYCEKSNDSIYYEDNVNQSGSVSLFVC